MCNVTCAWTQVLTKVALLCTSYSVILVRAWIRLESEFSRGEVGQTQWCNQDISLSCFPYQL